MLSTEQINQQLGRLQYRPGWMWYAYNGRFEGQHITIQATLEDSLRPGEEVVIRVDSAIPPMRCAGQLEEWLIWRVQRIESHEAREWFRDLAGRPIYDPHGPLAGRDGPPFGAGDHQPSSVASR